MICPVSYAHYPGAANDDEVDTERHRQHCRDGRDERHRLGPLRRRIDTDWNCLKQIKVGRPQRQAQIGRERDAVKVVELAGAAQQLERDHHQRRYDEVEAQNGAVERALVGIGGRFEVETPDGAARAHSEDDAGERINGRQERQDAELGWRQDSCVQGEQEELNSLRQNRCD